MTALPFYVVPLTHPTWEAALACATSLPSDAIPELRLDLFPQEDPEGLVNALKGRCVVTCRRVEDFGRFEADEDARAVIFQKALLGRPAWIDWEWDRPIPPWMRAALTRARLIRSVHVQPGVFDLDTRLQNLPEGDGLKWVGHASQVADNAYVQRHLHWAKQHRVLASFFLMGPRGITSRCMQAAWGGAFTYAAPDDGPPAAPGQVPLSTLRAWRCAKLTEAFQICGVVGDPVLHSRGPAFHNPRFQRAFKDLLYLPLECPQAEHAVAAMDALGLLGVSITAPLKETLPQALGLQGPLNTLWRRSPSSPWQGANTDAIALEQALQGLPDGPVVVLGAGGVAQASAQVVRQLGRPVSFHSRKAPLQDPGTPVGLIQATSLGMQPEDPLPFPEFLEAARPTLRWAVEWVYKEDTAFAQWAKAQGLTLVDGASLFQGQAEAQSQRFIQDCG